MIDKNEIQLSSSVSSLRSRNSYQETSRKELIQAINERQETIRQSADEALKIQNDKISTINQSISKTTKALEILEQLSHTTKEFYTSKEASIDTVYQ